MKICVLTTSFPRYKGDWQGGFVYELVKKLSEKNNVTLICPKVSRNQRYEKIDNLKIKRFSYPFLSKQGIKESFQKNFLFKITLPIFMLMFFISAFKEAKKSDLIHANWILCGFIGTKIKKILKKPLILTIHGTDIDMLPKKGLIKKLSLFTLRNADHIIAVSNSLKKKMLDLGIKTPTTVITDGVNLDHFKFLPKNKSGSEILYIGRLSLEKNISCLIKSLSLAKRQIPNIHLTIVGGGPERNNLEKEIKALNLINNITFEGEQPHHKIQDYLNKADMFILPSIREGFGMVLLEAMASGTAVIGSNVGGILDIIQDKKTGLLFKNNNHKELADKISYLLTNTAARKKLIANARKDVEEKFEWKNIAKKNMEIYKEIYEKISEKMKIAILISTGIGDIITLAPLTKKLKEIYPEAKICLYSFRGGFLENLNIDYIDGIVKLNSIKKFLKLFRENKNVLIGFGYYSRTSSFASILFYQLIKLFSKANKKIFYGELDSKQFRNKNMVKIKLDILKKLDLKIDEKDYNLFVPFSFEKLMQKRKNPLVIFHVGVKKDYFTRFWPRDRWIEIINYLKNNYKADICFIGGKDDIKKTENIINRLNFSVLNLVKNLSIKETAALINESDLFISTNSGPMWIAAALNKKQIVLCGPSKFSWEPYNNQARIIRHLINRKYCNPPCDMKKCKYKDNLCMRKIKTEQVIEAIDKIMKKDYRI